MPYFLCTEILLGGTDSWRYLLQSGDIQAVENSPVPAQTNKLQIESPPHLKFLNNYFNAQLFKQCISHCESYKCLLKLLWKDFPGGPVVKNLLCNAGDAGSIPSQGTKISHAMDLI